MPLSRSADPSGSSSTVSVMPQAEAMAISPAQYLDSRLASVRAALDECRAEVPASLALPAQDALDTVAERLALGVDHTVVALFGGTGSGKSSLFNALTQLQFADVGARRPTTSRAAACTWGDDASALLTFLGVDPDRRIRRESILDGDHQDDLAGLVFLDVPDYDSVTTAHALQVDRLVPLADILVWVLDPQKYADSALHDGYLRTLGARSEDIVVLLNHIDTVPEAAVSQLMDDVHALLEADGLGAVTVLPVSATRGDNLDAVRAILVDRVSRESHAARTAGAELDRICQRLLPAAAARPVMADQEATDDLIDALVTSAGVGVVADSIRTELARVIPAALAHPEPPARAEVSSARARWLAAATVLLPTPWMRSFEAAVAGADGLAAQTAEAVASVRLPAARRVGTTLAWWGSILLLIAGILAVVMGVFVGGPVGSWLGLSSISDAASGLIKDAATCGVGVLVVLICLLALWRLGKQRAARADKEADAYRKAAHERVAMVVRRALVDPGEVVLQRHQRLFDALHDAGGRV